MTARVLIAAALGLLLALAVWVFSGLGPDDEAGTPDGADDAASAPASSQPVRITEAQARMLVWELPETRNWAAHVRAKSGAYPTVVTRLQPQEPQSEGRWVLDAMESQSPSSAKWTTFAVNAATGEIRVIDALGDHLPLSQWRAGLEPAAAEPANLGRKVLEFDLLDPRKEITADLDDNLLLRAIATSGDAGSGWAVQVVEKPADDNSANLLYESPSWHGPHPCEIAAWHVADSYFPSTRDLAVRTYGHAVTIRLVAPAVKETEEQVTFTAGRAEVYFRPAARFAGENWMEVDDCLKRPKLLASGVLVEAKPAEPQPRTFAVTIKHGAAVVGMTLERDVTFYGDAASPGAVAIHHAYISNDDAVIVLDLSAKPFARFDLAHPDKSSYGHTHYRVLGLKDGKLRLEESQWASGKNEKARMRTVTVRLKKPSDLTASKWQDMESDDEGP